MPHKYTHTGSSGTKGLGSGRKGSALTGPGPPLPAPFEGASLAPGGSTVPVRGPNAAVTA
jgi:hypothetical protein